MWMAFPSESGSGVTRSGSNLLDDLEVRDALALGRGERFFAGILLLLPGRREQAHPPPPLDRRHHGRRAAPAPPAPPRRLHEAEEPQPARPPAGRGVRDGAPGGTHEPKEREPIHHAKE